MDVYILDSLYRRILMVDKYESLIWTERFQGYGDFELRLNSTLENRNRFPNGINITVTDSIRIMTVKTVEDTSDEDGKKILIVKGLEIVSILEDRLARGTLDDLDTVPKWILTGQPVAVAEQIFHDICVTGILDAGDIIPNVVEDDVIFPEDTIPEPSETIVYEIDMMSVYKAIQDLCKIYDFGFRLAYYEFTGELYWDVYTGSNRTTSQTSLAAVVFSPDLDNLQNTTNLSSIASYKNVAYVFSKAGSEIVYGLDIDPLVEGFERRALFIKADDIEVGDPDASDKMIQRGKEELAKARALVGFDGEVTQYSQYVYELHYYLGDLVEVRDNEGTTTVMQVTEQIRISDAEGERSYPTLTVNTFITPGSWASWDFNQEWEDVGEFEYWEDQP